ncbi:MAG: hypothetical protein HFG94_09935 [Dorea sp.]|jgi:hypothetical protein|nr:hypothetical protein [Dorea sp.]
MVKLGKKIVSLALVLGLTLSMGVVSFASDSASGKPVYPDKGGSASTDTVTTDDVVSSPTADVTISKYVPGSYTVADAKIRTTAGLRKILGNYYREGMNLELLHVTEVIPERAVTKENPLTVDFTVPKVASGDTIFVLHCYDNENWEVIIPNAVGTQFVSATFTSLSPVAFVKATRPSASGNNTGKSPKTGMF